MSERIDKTLVKLKLADTRSRAQELIKRGHVFYASKQISKSSFTVDDESLVEVRGQLEYVGRGAFKIKGAAEIFGVSFQDKLVADIGASTGGFTDYALEQGATKVYAIDVGHDQLALKLKEDPRVVNMEGVNIRHPLELEQKVDIAVVDLSYISLKLTLDTIWSLINGEGIILCLIKPQFEIGKERLGKNGIVKKSEDHLLVLNELYSWCTDKKYHVAAVASSPIEGRSGNREFFFLFDKKISEHKVQVEDLKDLVEEQEA